MYDLLSWQGNEISRVCIYRLASCQLNRWWMVYHIGELIKISICSEIDFVALNYHMLQLLYYQHTSYHEQGKQWKWRHHIDAGVLIEIENWARFQKKEWKMKNSAANLEACQLHCWEAYEPCKLIWHCQILEYVQSECFDVLYFRACNYCALSLFSFVPNDHLLPKGLIIILCIGLMHVPMHHFLSFC